MVVYKTNQSYVIVTINNTGFISYDKCLKEGTDENAWIQQTRTGGYSKLHKEKFYISHSINGFNVTT